MVQQATRYPGEVWPEVRRWTTCVVLYKAEDAKGGQVVLSHVDDMEVSAKRTDFEKLVQFMKDEGLKIKVERPLDVESGSMSFLKRRFRSMGDGSVEITMNSKYIEGLVEVLELGEAFSKKVPCPSAGCVKSSCATAIERGGNLPYHKN